MAPPPLPDDTTTTTAASATDQARGSRRAERERKRSAPAAGAAAAGATAAGVGAGAGTTLLSIHLGPEPGDPSPGCDPPPQVQVRSTFPPLPPPSEPISQLGLLMLRAGLLARDAIWHGEAQSAFFSAFAAAISGEVKTLAIRVPTAQGKTLAALGAARCSSNAVLVFVAPLKALTKDVVGDRAPPTPAIEWTPAVGEEKLRRFESGIVVVSPEDAQHEIFTRFLRDRARRRQHNQAGHLVAVVLDEIHAILRWAATIRPQAWGAAGVIPSDIPIIAQSATLADSALSALQIMLDRPFLNLVAASTTPRVSIQVCQSLRVLGGLWCVCVFFIGEGGGGLMGIA